MIDAAFTEAQERLADYVCQQADLIRRARHSRSGASASLAHCPRCGRLMVHRLYDYEHAVEVDGCVFCGLVWFDKDKLEVLQILIERATG
jgi:Zn ribbon nucleic-acid-binding protein